MKKPFIAFVFLFNSYIFASEENLVPPEIILEKLNIKFENKKKYLEKLTVKNKIDLALNILAKLKVNKIKLLDLSEDEHIKIEGIELESLAFELSELHLSSYMDSIFKNRDPHFAENLVKDFREFMKIRDKLYKKYKKDLYIVFYNIIRKYILNNYENFIEEEKTYLLKIFPDFDDDNIYRIENLMNKTKSKEKDKPEEKKLLN